MRVRGIVVAFFFAVIAANACKKNDAMSPCSTGPAYEEWHLFRVDESVRTTHACIPRCGTADPVPTAIGSMEMLPSGSCTVDEESCGMEIQLECECPFRGNGAISGYACTCVDGRWDCVVASQGGGPGCGPPPCADPRDASTTDRGG